MSKSGKLLTGALVGLGLNAGTAEGAPPASSPIEQAYRDGRTAPDEQAARAHFQRGIDLARSELARAPDAPNALLWLAANLAEEALTHGKFHALRVIPEVEATLLHLERVAPGYDHAAAARALANLYWKAPALISIGSSRKATQYFQLALARAPTFPGNQATAAAYFASLRDCARAQPLARAVAARADLDSLSPDAAEWRKLAADVLRDCR
jgi:hypothetical protein